MVFAIRRLHVAIRRSQETVSVSRPLISIRQLAKILIALLLGLILAVVANL